MDLATLLVVNALTFLVLLLWVKRKVDRELSADRALEQVRKEIGDLITELNATTERNITLIEDRVKRLNTLLEQTDRKIGVLKKESEKHDVGTAVYNDLIERRRKAARHDSTEVGSRKGNEDIESPAQSPTSESKYSTAEAGAGVASGGQGDPASTRTGADSGVGDGARQSESRGSGLRNRVRDLHRAGFAAESIAHKLGSTLGEVELIIGLEGGDYVQDHMQEHVHTEYEKPDDGKQQS